MYIQLEKNTLIYLASVVPRLDSAIHRINLSPVDSAISLPNTYPLDSDLSRDGQRYPTFEQPGRGAENVRGKKTN